MLHSSPFLLPKSAEMKNFVGIEIGKLLAREFRSRAGTTAVLRTDHIIIKASVLIVQIIHKYIFIINFIFIILTLVLYRIRTNKNGFLFNPAALKYI